MGRRLRLEWRLLRADGTVPLIAVLFALASLLALVNGHRWVVAQRAAQVTAAHEEQTRHAAQQADIARLESGALTLPAFADPRNPQAAAGRLGPRYAMLPHAPLAALAIGQSDVLPSYLKVTTEAREQVLAAAETTNPHHLLSGRFDLAFVVIYLLPLLILAGSYDLLSAERERGTLRLALSQPVSARSLLAGKLAVRAALYAALVATLALLAWSTVVDRSAAGGAATMAVWVVCVLAYGGFWFALAALVNGWGRPSATNAMVLASGWLLFVVLVPSMTNVVAQAAYPVPSRVEMIQAMRVAAEETSRQGSQVLARYYDDHPELAGGGARTATDASLLRVAIDAEIAARVHPVSARYETQLAGQQQVVARLRLLSPALLLQDALNDLSGTGQARHQWYTAAVSAFHAQWRDYFTGLIRARQPVLRYDDLPRFAFADESAAVLARRVGGSLAWLVAAAALAGVAAAITLRRVSVV